MFFRDPAATLTQKAKEEGAAVVDAIQAHPDDIPVVSSILLGHAPSQVYIDQSQLAPLAPILQVRKHALDQVVPVGVHVVKRAADEYVNLFPS